MVTVIVTGKDSQGDQLRVIEESGDKRLCSDTWNFPVQCNNAAGASLPDNTILVCGGDCGYGPSHDAQSSCYKLTDGEWKEMGSLQTARAYHASSRTEKGKGI